MGEHERLEQEGPERATVVSHDRDHRFDLTGHDIDLAQITERVPEPLLIVGQRELDGVVLVRGRGHGSWPISGAKSARACRSTGRTSRSTYPPRGGYLEVLEGPTPSSADFFHTLSSTVAPPSA